MTMRAIPQTDSPPRHPKGIAPYRDGWRVYVKVRGRYRSRTFPGDTPQKTLEEERENLRVDLRRELAGQAPPPPDKETFAEAAQRYLLAVRALSTYQERERDIGLWVAAFGPRLRRSIASAEIRTMRDRWLLQGRKMVQQSAAEPAAKGRRRRARWNAVSEPLAPSTVNHRLRALANLWTVLDGLRADNPAREVPEVDEANEVPRAIPADLVECILAALPDRGAARTRGQSRLTVSQAKARLQVMAWTGLPPAQLAQLRPQDVDWDHATIAVRRRQKGKGVAAARRPVTARGLEALKALDAADAWGRFSVSTIRRAWRRACAAVETALAKDSVVVDLSALRPYDLRHTVATAILTATGDLAATQALMGHADPRTTLQYAKGAVPAWLAEAAAQLDAYQREETAPKRRKRGRKLHGMLHTSKTTNRTRR